MKIWYMESLEMPADQSIRRTTAGISFVPKIVQQGKNRTQSVGD